MLTEAHYEYNYAPEHRQQFMIPSLAYTVNDSAENVDVKNQILVRNLILINRCIL